MNGGDPGVVDAVRAAGPVVWALWAAGLMQLVMAATNFPLHRALNWSEELLRVDPLTRAVFRTYQAYIVGATAVLGAITLVCAAELAAGGTLARCVAGYAAAYWGMRVVGRYTGFPGRVFPKHPPWNLISASLVPIAGSMALLYGAVAAGLIGGAS